MKRIATRFTSVRKPALSSSRDTDHLFLNISLINTCNKCT